MNCMSRLDYLEAENIRLRLQVEAQQLVIYDQQHLCREAEGYAHAEAVGKYNKAWRHLSNIKRQVKAADAANYAMGLLDEMAQRQAAYLEAQAVSAAERELSA